LTWRHRTSPWGGKRRSRLAGDCERRGDSGVALLIVITALILVLALTSALVLTSLVETRIAAAFRDDALVLSGADAAASRVLVDLRGADWDAVLGGEPSSFSDGAPAGGRTLPDGTMLDFDTETADLRCGRPSGCSDADIAVVAEERPWGAHNPRWRLYAHGPLSALLPSDPSPPRLYLAMWIADDPSDSDEDPFRDGDAAENPGRGILMVAGRAYGPGGSRRTVQLVIEREGAEVRVLARHER
jgi:hypothetical protein